MDSRVDEINKDVTHIQNTIWKNYKDYLKDNDLKKYTQKMSDLCKEYANRNEYNNLFPAYVSNLAISWVPIINEIARILRGDNL